MDLTKPSKTISNDINIQSLDIQKTDDNPPKLDIKLKILISCTAIFCLLTIILLIISASNTETVNNTVTAVSPANQELKDINHMIKSIIDYMSAIISMAGLIFAASTALQVTSNIIKQEQINYKQIMMLIILNTMFIFNRQISTGLTHIILLMLKLTANNPEANIRGILWLI